MPFDRSRFTATEGTPPACGLDFEPNKPHNKVSSVLVEDCEFDGNFSSGVTFPLVRLNHTSAPVSVVLRRCRFTGNGLAGVRVHPTWSDDACVCGDILIEDCVFAANMGGALIFAWMPPSRFNVKVRNSILDCQRNWVAVESPWNGRGILVNSRILLADMAGKRVHFSVPAKSKGFKMEFLVKNGNSLSFRVLDSKGKVRAERSLSDKGCLVDIIRESTSEDEVWTLDVGKSIEPFNLRFGRDVTPVVFDNPLSGLRE